MRAVVFLLVVAAAQAYNGNPLTPVVKLLQDLKATIASDEEAETKSFSRLSCWCKKTMTDLKNDITAQAENAANLKSEMNKARAAASSSNNLAKNAAEELRKAETLLQSQTKLRNGQHKTNMEAIDAASAQSQSLAEAIRIIAAGTATSLTQTMKDHISTVAASGHYDMEILDMLVGNSKSFLQTKYTPQSGQVIGMLKQMLAQQMENIQVFWTTEMQQQHAHEEMEAEQNSIINTQNDIRINEDKRAGDADALASEKEQSWMTNNDAHIANEQMFESTYEECKNKASDQANRSADRQREIEAVNGALNVLDNPEARNKMMASSKSFFFIQTSALVDRLYKKGGFNIEGVIDDVIQTLNDDMARDVENRDKCIKDEQDFTMALEKADHEVSREADQIAANKAEIEKMNAEIKSLDESIAQTQQALRDLTNTDEERSNNFMQRQADDKTAVDMLKKALSFLEAYYTGFLQKPDGKFALGKGEATEHSHKAAQTGKGNAVVQLIRQVIENTQADMKTDVDHDAADSAAFNADKNEMEETIARFEAQKQAATEQKNRVEADMNKNNLEKDNESDISKDNQENLRRLDEKKNQPGFQKPGVESCKFLRKNFDLRRKARAQEIKGLQDAKATIRKANFSELDSDK